MSFDHAPDPIIMYTRSVETILDAHEIELYWGSIAGLVERDSIVLLSTNIFHPYLRGKAWNALQHKFPSLIGKEQEMKICLRMIRIQHYGN